MRRKSIKENRCLADVRSRFRIELRISVATIARFYENVYRCSETSAKRTPTELRPMCIYIFHSSYDFPLRSPTECAMRKQSECNSESPTENLKRGNEWKKLDQRVVASCERVAHCSMQEIVRETEQCNS